MVQFNKFLLGVLATTARILRPAYAISVNIELEETPNELGTINGSKTDLDATVSGYSSHGVIKPAAGACNYTKTNFISSIFADRICSSQQEVPGDLWSVVDLYEGKSLRRSNVFPSPGDLCESASSLLVGDNKANTIDDCMNHFRGATNHTLKCFVLDSSKDNNSINVFSLERLPSVKRVATRVELKRIAVIAIVISIMKYLGVGNRQIKAQNILLLNVIFAALCAYSEAPCWFSHMGMRSIVKESFVAFREVHPVDNTSVAVAHFATYWIHAAAWFSKTPMKMMIWLLLTEVVVGGVNEWAHHNEWNTEVRCMRVAFIDGAKQNGYDNFFREYWLGPCFVYFYLLPKFIGHWAKAAFVGT